MDSIRVFEEALKNEDDEDSETSFPELLNFACRVQTLISELLLLSGRIPPEFLDRRYDPVLFDLRYFDSPNDFEAKINGNVGLETLEDQLRESCSGFMQRFFLLANGIVVYHQELLKYLNDLQEGVHYQSTMENENGRQLLIESLALFGFLLLLMEHQMRGSLREKLLVAHLRHDRCFDAPNLEAMCLLCRVRPSTMTIPLHPVKSSMMTWVQKPEDLFIRFPFPKKVVDSVISCLRNCDLYNRTRHYPDPNHRYVALASQAGYLYVMLFYSPEMLHSGYVMREIVDRFFKDSLVVPISMHFTVDLSSSWDAYTGAKASVSSCLSPSFMRDLCQAHYLKVKDLICELQLVLSNNVLTRDYVLNNSHTLLSLVRNCNVSLRWLLLHRSCNDKKLRDIVTSTGISHQIEEGTLVSLLLKTSQVEFNMKSIYTELLESKGTLWQESKGHASKSMQELSEYYSGFRVLGFEQLNHSSMWWMQHAWSPLGVFLSEVKFLIHPLSLGSIYYPWGCVGPLDSKKCAVLSLLTMVESLLDTPELSSKMKDEDLMDLFKKLSAQVCSLDYANIGNAGKKLSHMISTVKEVEQRDEIKEDLQIKHHFPVIQKYLRTMLQALSLHHDTLLTFSVITEAVYMWGFIGNFTDKLWKKIEEDSSIVLNLPSLFLKFRSVLNAPLLRLSQNGSSDLPFVSAYFSAEYVSRICAILEIIPAMLCRILNDDVIHTLQPFYPPKRIERDNLQSFIKPDPHFHLTEAFNQICIFSQGVMAMRRTLLGQIDLDVKKWIEVKIRKEISKLFEDKLKSFFLYPSVGLEELEMNLQTLTSYLLSQFRRMECFQDLIDLQGTRVWEEEFTCFLKRCAQKECDDFASQRNQESIVMPLQVNFSNPQTFLGHIMCHILKLTMPSRSMYIEPMSGWFDAEGRELLGLRFFELLESWYRVGPVGMASLDSLLAFIIQKNLEHALRGLKNLMGARCLEQLQLLDDALGPPTSLPLLGWSTYQQMAIFADTLWEPWVESLACIGQLQLIRCLIASKLKSACKVKAGSLFASLDGMIASVSIQTEKSFKGSKKEDRGTKELLLLELSKQGQLCGFSSPLKTVCISEDPPAFLGRCASVVTISQLPRYVLHSHLGTLTSHLKKVSLDFSPVVIGLGTFLRQFNPVHLIQYVQYMGQYIRVTAEACGAMQETRKGNTDPTSEVLKSIFWLMYFCKHMGIQKDLIDSCLPLSLLAVLQA